MKTTYIVGNNMKTIKLHISLLLESSVKEIVWALNNNGYSLKKFTDGRIIILFSNSNCFGQIASFLIERKDIKKEKDHEDDELKKITAIINSLDIKHFGYTVSVEDPNYFFRACLGNIERENNKQDHPYRS